MTLKKCKTMKEAMKEAMQMIGDFGERIMALKKCKTMKEAIQMIGDYTRVTALKKCKECGKEIRSDAKACPHCGKKQKMRFFLKFIIVFGLIGVIGAALIAPKPENNIERNIQKEETVQPVKYKIVGEENVPYAGIKRMTYRVVVPDTIKRNQIEPTAKKIIDEKSNGDPSIFEITIWMFSDEKIAFEGPFDVAMIEWAPNGDWGSNYDIDVTDKSTHKMKVTIRDGFEENLKNKKAEEKNISAESVKTKEVSLKEFPITYNKFLQRYNKATKNLGIKDVFKVKEKNDNGEFLTIQFVSKNEFLGMVATANNKTNKLRDIIFIGGSDGSASSTVNSMFGMTAVVMAIEDPNMPVNSRKNIVDSLGLLNNKLLESGKIEFNRNDVKYLVTTTESMGIWLTATPN